VSDDILRRRPLTHGPATALILATGLLASTAAMQVVPGVLGPVLQSDLHISQATLGVLSAAAFGGMALGMLPGGVLTDRFGERAVMAVGVGGAGVAMFIGSLVASSNLLLLALLAVSIGAAFAATGGPKSIVRWFAPDRRATAMGVRQTGVPLGGLLAALILPTVALLSDWRFAVRCTAVTAIVAAVLFYFFYREAIYRVPSPIKPAGRWTFIGRPFLAATACAVTLQTAQGCALTYVVVDMHGMLGLPPATAALFLALVQIGGLTGRVSWGAIADRIGAGRALTLVSLLGVVCCIAMSSLSRQSNLVAVGIVCLCLGLTALSWNAVYISMVAAMAPDRATGSALGLGLTVVLLGFFIVPAFGQIADVAKSFPVAWLALAVFMALGCAVSVGAWARAR
jgi:nitrate/nitrite transporter NarK